MMSNNTENNNSIGHLLELAIQSEHQCEQFYQLLADQFEGYEAVAAFWKAYAFEETGHARWLEELRVRLSDHRLNDPVDVKIMAKARQSVEQVPAMLLRDIKNLEDAYQTANEIEHDETNAVFAFLITHFSDDEKTRAFLRAQLRDHVGRLSMLFPQEYRDSAIRAAIPVKDR